MTVVDVGRLKSHLDGVTTLRLQGRVLGVTGLRVRLALPGARVGDVVSIRRRGAPPLAAEVVGFDDLGVIALPLGEALGVGPEDLVESSGAPLQVHAGSALLGRVLDGLGQPLDGALPEGLAAVPVDRPSPPALERRRVDTVLGTGLRVVDGLLTVGVGQRVGLFAGSGVGKSTLLASMARGSSADVVVVALVGERGREVKDFIEQTLGREARARSVVVVATSDSPALVRLRAAQVATAQAEYFRDQGASVLLLVDSITRVARAQREVGLAAGEPPARRGYPPSVFALLPRLLERSGQGARGAITAIYTVLVEGDDLEEPVADEVRGILDGHIVLSRAVAARGHYPAVDVLASLSRVMPAIADPEHRAAATRIRGLLATLEEKRELVSLGAYKTGSDPRVDEALAARSSLESFLCQSQEEIVEFGTVRSQLIALAAARSRAH